MSRIIRHLGFKCFDLLRKIQRAPKGYAVLLYHQIVEEYDILSSMALNECVDINSFRQQMEYIKKYCIVISIEELCQRICERIQPDGFYVAVTFDDGYKNNIEIALPVLKDLQIPATFFLTTDFVGQKCIPWWDEWRYKISQISDVVSLKLQHNSPCQFDLRKKDGKIKLFSTLVRMMEYYPDKESNTANTFDQILDNNSTPRFYMNWKEAEWLSQQKDMSIGAHSVQHQRHKMANSLLNEFLTSKNIIEEKLKQQIAFYAYSFGTNGELDESLFQEVKKAGFIGAFTALNGINHPADNLFSLKRIPVAGKESFEMFLTRLYMANWFGVVKKLAEKRKRAKSA